MSKGDWWNYKSFQDAVLDSVSVTPAVVFADLPDPVTAGMGARSFVLDATVNSFGDVVAAGGGALRVPVYSDGTDWKVGG